MFRLGYNTNGLAHHRVLDALRLLAKLEYEGVALTPDVGQLDPFHSNSRDIAAARRWIDDLGLSVVIETGARYLLDAERKHYPTLLDPDVTQRSRRLDFLKRSVELAVELGAPVVSVWSGCAPDDVTLEADAPVTNTLAERHLDRLADGLDGLVEFAASAGVTIGFEPEPGMFVERPDGYAQLVRHMGSSGAALGLTLDVGHCVVTGDEPVSAVVDRFASQLVHVHLDDCPRGVHEHRMFGLGDLDLTDALGALVRCDFQGLAAVELSRDAHRGPVAAREAMQRLRNALTTLPNDLS